MYFRLHLLSGWECIDFLGMFTLPTCHDSEIHDLAIVEYDESTSEPPFRLLAFVDDPECIELSLITFSFYATSPLRGEPIQEKRGCGSFLYFFLLWSFLARLIEGDRGKCLEDGYWRYILYFLYFFLYNLHYLLCFRGRCNFWYLIFGDMFLDGPFFEDVEIACSCLLAYPGNFFACVF